MREKMIVEEIGEELDRHADPAFHERIQQFTDEETKRATTYRGIRTPVVRTIAQKYYKEIKNKEKKEIFSLCEELLMLRRSEERIIAFDWAFRLRKNYEFPDFLVFESWLKWYVTGWGSCDDLCTHALGYLLYRFPELVPKTTPWAYAENRWQRRASAVVFVYSLRRKLLLDSAFERADILLHDDEDLVQKGYGWMLKEAANHYPKKVFQFVMDRKATMPRTSLRYAIEKMPVDWRKKAMMKE
jgi:3-methyladenine DNA glycosylase AlkD